jgi:N-methylhydantoinase B
VLAAIERIYEEAERRCRNTVSRLADGVYEAESFLDDDGVQMGDPVRLHAKVTVKAGHMTIDFSGCSGERKAGINSRTLAGARVAYKALTGPLDPVNEGSFSALDVVIPEGSIMMARYPAPMAGWSQMLPLVVDTVVKALAPAMPERTPAAHYGMLSGGIVFFGIDPKTGRRFVVQSIEGGGWGGRPFEDGESATVTVCQGDVRNASIEGIELKCPVLVQQRALRQDSGGAGKYRGGLGLDVRVKNLVEGRWNLARPHRAQCPPWGLWGGKIGFNEEKFLRLPGEARYADIDANRYPAPANAEVMLHTGTGGGWGDPLERDPALVAQDVLEGFVSSKAAADQYGVVLHDDRSVDEAQTAKLRARFKAAAA